MDKVQKYNSFNDHYMHRIFCSWFVTDLIKWHMKKKINQWDDFPLYLNTAMITANFTTKTESVCTY
jgi:hypothetical protein